MFALHGSLDSAVALVDITLMTAFSYLFLLGDTIVVAYDTRYASIEHGCGHVERPIMWVMTTWYLYYHSLDTITYNLHQPITWTPRHLRRLHLIVLLPDQGSVENPVVPQLCQKCGIRPREW